MRSLQKLPWRPVMPWTSTRSVAAHDHRAAASTAALTASSISSNGSSPRRSRTSATASSSPVPWMLKNTGIPRLQRLPGRDDAGGHHVGARERAAEVDHQAPHLGVGEHQLERRPAQPVGLAADLEEVRRSRRRSGARRPSWSSSARRRSPARRRRRRARSGAGHARAPAPRARSAARAPPARRARAGAVQRHRRPRACSRARPARRQPSAPSGLISTSSASLAA